MTLTALTKRCKQCGEERPLEGFRKKRNGRFGVDSTCRACHRQKYRSTYKSKRFSPEQYARRHQARDAVTPGTKACSRCFAVKPLEAFHVSRRSTDGRCSWCADCVRKTSRLYVRSERQRRQSRLKHAHQISLSEYETLLSHQGGCCAICGSSDSHGKSGHFVVDHDHRTGVIRALLCNKCNPALGLMDDDPERLEAAARYLRRFASGDAE